MNDRTLIRAALLMGLLALAGNVALVNELKVSGVLEGRGRTTDPETMQPPANMDWCAWCNSRYHWDNGVRDCCKDRRISMGCKYDFKADKCSMTECSGCRDEECCSDLSECTWYAKCAAKD